jgi:hypothetical protein
MLLSLADWWSEVARLANEYLAVDPQGDGLLSFIQERNPYLLDPPPGVDVTLSLPKTDGTPLILQYLRGMASSPRVNGLESERSSAGQPIEAEPEPDSEEERALLLQEAKELLERLEARRAADPAKQGITNTRRQQVVSELASNTTLPARRQTGPGSRGGRSDSIEKQFMRPPPGVRPPRGYTRRTREQGEPANPYRGLKF